MNIKKDDKVVVLSGKDKGKQGKVLIADPKAGKVVVDYVSKYYSKYAFMPCKNTGFALAELGNDAGIYGAARLVL